MKTNILTTTTTVHYLYKAARITCVQNACDQEWPFNIIQSSSTILTPVQEPALRPTIKIGPPQNIWSQFTTIYAHYERYSSKPQNAPHQTWTPSEEESRFMAGTEGNVKEGVPHHHQCHISYPLLAAEHSPCKAPWSGTPSRTTSAYSRTMSPLDSA